MKINVTQSDIDTAQRQNSENCPIAKAVKREFPDGCVVSVSSQIMVWHPSIEKIVITDKTPTEALAFIYEFDMNFDDMQPFSFDANLTVPDEWTNLESN